MKKQFTHLETHPHATCKNCGKAIKMNIFMRKAKPPSTCFKCYKTQNPGHSNRDFSVWPKHDNNFFATEKGLRQA